MRDPYDVLGVSKTASVAEIKSAFRRQAKKLHPDANKHDPRAAARFAELNTAYEILGEESKRKAFDRGEIDEAIFRFGDDLLRHHHDVVGSRSQRGAIS